MKQMHKSAHSKPRIWDRDRTGAFRELLLAWYRTHRRPLPWRRRPTPFRVWISEIMLQQTRVQAAIPYYDRFLKRFPDVAALASASEREILKYWAGLGYYRRAHRLGRAARMIAREFGGKFPSTLADIRRLPGVGRYTAGAIYSIAFQGPEAIVDANVRRIIRRLHGLPQATDGFCQGRADALLARENPGAFNQAMMELGALICLPSMPRCSECPVRSLCRTGRAGKLPARRRRAAAETESLEIVLVLPECGGRMAVMKQASGGFIPGDWGFPWKAVAPGRRPRAVAEELALEYLGFVPRLQTRPTVRHAITYRRIVAHVFRAALDASQRPNPASGNLTWRVRAAIEGLLTSSLFRKAAGCRPRQ